MSTDLVVYDNNTKIADTNDYYVYLAEEYIKYNDKNPMVWFGPSDGPLYFYNTRESLMDMDVYKSFITNCIARFRRSRAYKAYKSHLMSIGLDRSQILGNVADGMAKIEMHHNFLTIYDITILISQEHKLDNIPIVMLDETSHELYHSNPDMYIPISMTFGKWWDLLLKYRYGITLDIAYKVIRYINKCNENNELNRLECYNLKNTIMSWGGYNETNNRDFATDIFNTV